jgi:hypothetical protein
VNNIKVDCILLAHVTKLLDQILKECPLPYCESNIETFFVKIRLGSHKVIVIRRRRKRRGIRRRRRRYRRKEGGLNWETENTERLTASPAVEERGIC